jgi:hypothetical protein
VANLKTDQRGGWYIGYDERAIGGYDERAIGGYDERAIGGYDERSIDGYDERALAYHLSLARAMPSQSPTS